MKVIWTPNITVSVNSSFSLSFSQVTNYISVYRYIVVVHPLRLQGSLTRSHCRLVLAMLWLLAAVLSLPVIAVTVGSNYTSGDILPSIITGCVLYCVHWPTPHTGSRGVQVYRGHCSGSAMDWQGCVCLPAGHPPYHPCCHHHLLLPGHHQGPLEVQQVQ